MEEVNEMAVVKFDITEAEISELRSRYMELTIKGMDDKPGFDAVHRARIDIKGRRVFVEKTGKIFREKAVKYQKDVIAEEKRIIGLLAPIEDYLSDQENRVAEEIARIKAEAEAKIQAIFQARENRLLDMGCRFDRIAMAYSYGELVAPVAMVKVAPDDMFEKICVAIQGAVDAEKAAKAAEETRRLEEQALILKVQQEQEEERQRQAQERERLAAEGKAIQDAMNTLAREKQRLISEEAARVRWVEEQKKKVEIERLRQEELVVTVREAAEKAKKETEERIQRETEAKWAREKAEAEEKARKEEAARVRAEKKAARLPDKDKLTAFCNNYFARATPNQNIGDLKTDEGRLSFEAIWIIVQTAEHDCREIVEKL